VRIENGLATVKEPSPPIWEVVINSRWPLFKNATLLDYPQKSKTVLKSIEAGRGLYIQGSLGTGKTHLLISIYRYVSEIGRSPVLTSVMEMIDSIKSEMDTKEDWRVPMFQSADWLFLDDVGSGLLTRYTADRLLAIVTYRYDHQLPTVWTSNFPLDALAKALNRDGNMDGDRIASRIQGMCDLISLTGEDRRRQ